MHGVVVGTSGTNASSAAVRWASVEATRRGVPLTLVHAWDTDADITVGLEADERIGLHGPTTSHAVHESVPAALLAEDPELLVIGAHTGSRHLRHVTHACVHRARCPLIVVPTPERAPTGRVLVGVCETSGSRAALRWAADEARLRNCDLVVVHAWQLHPESAADLLHVGRAALAQAAIAHDRVDRWVREVVEPASVEIRVKRGAPLDTLLAAGDEADLIVLGNHLQPRLARALHGAVTDDLCGLAPCPIAVVPPSYGGADDPEAR